MIVYKTAEEIELMRESALFVSRTLGLVAEEIREGITTKRLNEIAETYIFDNGGKPSFKGYKGKSAVPFPSALCISVNEEVVHGIPSERVIKDGDIVSVDCGILKNGFHGDHAYTFGIGNLSAEAKRLLTTTKECLYIGLAYARKNYRIGDLSYAIQNHAEKRGYSVVRELVGHGLGKSLHEEPAVPNYGKKGTGVKMINGMVIAVEPMINSGTRKVKELADFWTIVTADKLPSAHFEHDVAIVNGKPEILSTFDYVYEALRKKGEIIEMNTLQEAQAIPEKYGISFS
jgi:methionyl aminopeptidase